MQNRSKKPILIGTRGSLLALAQAKSVARELQKKNPGVDFKLSVIKTTGDEYQAVELFRKNNIGVFTKEIEKQLLSGKVDIAVHSLKDLPTDLPRGLVLAAFPKRLDTSDVLISKHKFNLKTLPQGASVATGSPRRKRQLEILRPDLKIVEMRGNLDTRVRRVLEKKEFHAVVLAKAGLLRLKRYLKYAVSISPDKILPAVGQAALGLEARASDKTVLKMLQKLNHAPTQVLVGAERAFLKTLHGGCRVPVGIHSKISRGCIEVKAFVFSTLNDRWISGAIKGPVKKYEALGTQLAKNLLSCGAGKLMQEAREGGAK